MFAAMAFAAAAVGMRFRLHSIATIVILLAFGVLTSLDARPGEPADAFGRAVGAHQHRRHSGAANYRRARDSTPLVWVVVLAVVLFRTRVEPAKSDMRNAIQGPGLSARHAE